LTPPPFSSGRPDRRPRAPFGDRRPPSFGPRGSQGPRDDRPRDNRPREDRPRREARPPAPPIDPQRLPRGVKVVFEDADLLVVDKPPGLLSAVMPGQNGDNLFDILKEYVQSSSRRKRREKLWIIHRLDREASGLLVFAKSEAAFLALKEDLKARRVHRLYHVVVEGVFEHTQSSLSTQAPSGTIQSFLLEEESGDVRSVPVGESAKMGAGRSSRPTHLRESGDDEPRLAVTHWKLLAAGRGRSLLQVRLETGRKHQIRVHMRDLKRPVVGDLRYGSRETVADDRSGRERLCLHATELGFRHPTRGEAVRFTSPPPHAFWRLLGLRPPDKLGPEMFEGEVATTEPAPAAPTQPALQTPIDVRPGDDDVADLPEGDEAREDPIAEDSSVNEASVTEAIEVSSKPERGPSKPAAPGRGPVADTSWDHVAGWYRSLIDEGRSDHHRMVVIPGVLRLLNPRAGQKIVDLACGEGILCRRLAELDVHAVGIDASPKLITSATESLRAQRLRTPPEFLVGDARRLASKAPELAPARNADSACCVLALMNIDPLTTVFEGVASLLKPGGAFVAVILHPAFRSPGQTAWGWDYGDEDQGRGAHSRGPGFGGNARGPKPSQIRQYRRVDGYLTPGQREIVMNPGGVAIGKEAVTTWTFHRPLQTYVRHLAEAGLLIDAVEEWPSIRVSQPGPRAHEENRARREIPMFMAIRAVKAR
jgi:23S rRNA-/tRNA-specific pseudouridylate synthase/SAM-dependent methyltransferase